MRQPTRLITDSADRYKLKVSLPGGRYQLSLDDRAVIVLTDGLELDVRDTVPDPFVPFFVATGDAWFPKQRDIDTVLVDLPTGGNLTDKERSVLVSYVTENPIAARNENYIKSVLEESPIAEAVDFSELQIQSLPDLPNVLAESGSTESAAEESKPHDEAEVSEPQADSEHEQTPPKPDSEEKILEALQQIPGIGPTRAERLVTGGVRSLTGLAESRPVDIQEIEGISEGLATVAVEGAREVIGETIPADQRLRNQTGVTDDVFEPALASLAGAGVPASEAMPTLRVLYGPTVADIDAVSGQQAYFLWEAGYQTPHDLLEASTEELEAVYQVGSTTAPKIQTAARELLESAEY